MRAALRVGATTGVMHIFSGKKSAANNFDWPCALVGATSVAMESRQPLTPDHNAVAPKDKRLSPPSADPEGGAQDARRFPIESG
jgi:hypothetical protein